MATDKKQPPKTLGHILLEDAIPAGYRPDGPYTKGALYKNMVRLAKDDPATYVKTIAKVKTLGDEFATLEGISVGLDDIAPMYKQRDAVLKPALAQIQKAKTLQERQAILGDTQKKLLDYTKQHQGTMGDMARSGGRGNMVQLMKAVGSPVAANDEHDEIQPWLITRSYSEGLKPSEWWATAREARMAAVKSNIEVTEPGDLSKILTNNMSDQVVTDHDCGTHNGVRLSVDNPAAVNRYTAQAAGPVAAKTVVTPRVISDLKKAGVADVLVRSPMTCEEHSGVCQLCMGLTPMGQLNRIGENVGVRAAQALGQPLTQLALNAKHGVRTAGTAGNGLTGLTGFRALIESPASFKNKAALAPVDGKVEAVTPAPQGGMYVTVAGHRIHAGPGLAVRVRPGDTVHAGDALSDGAPRPDEVVSLKGLGAGRDYMVSALDHIYKDSNLDVDRRHFEVLAKSALNYVQVDHADDRVTETTGVVRGDVIPYNRFRKIVQDSVTSTPLQDAVGKPLGRAVFQHTAGTFVTRPMVEEFRKAGLTEVPTTSAGIRVTPIMAPATRNPLLNPDWLVRMGHRYLKQSLLEGAHEGQSTDIHSTSPVPGLVFGTEFGEGMRGRY